MIDLTYRGPLASCNYDCAYCPFAKTEDDAARQARDKAAVARFVDWVARQQDYQLRILFTPWGEALVRKWYRDAVVALSHMPNVSKVVVQTNLSRSPDWLSSACHRKVALWTTYHPGESDRGKFLTRLSQLDALGVAYSVGMVGLKQYQAEAERLRQDLPKSVYLWINAYKDEANYYQPEAEDLWSAIDPWFSMNLKDYASKGKSCNAGVNALSIDGQGNATACHFVKRPLGNIYAQPLASILQPLLRCPNQQCDCYIGYRHLKQQDMRAVYGERILERIPISFSGKS